MSGLEDCNHCGTVGFLNEGFGFCGGQGFNQRFGSFAVFVAAANRQNVGKFLRGVGGWVFGQKQRIDDVSIQCIVAVDDCEIHVRQGAWQLSRFDFQNVNVFRVVDDVLYGGIETNTLSQGNETVVSQQLQSAGFVGWVVRNSDLCAVGNVGEVVALACVNAQRLEVNFYRRN